MTYHYKAFGLAAALALAPIAGSAATVSVQANAPDSWSAVDQTATTTLSAGASWTTAPAIVSGSKNGHYKSPFDPAKANNGSNVPDADAISGWQHLTYFTVGSPGLQESPAVLKLSQKKSILSVLWGSVDTYNAVELFRDGSSIHTVSGQDVLNNGGQPAASGAALVRISGVGLFDQVKFYSNFNGGNLTGSDKPAFEFSNVTAAVPLPAAGWLMIAGLGGLAALRRRKRAA